MCSTIVSCFAVSRNLKLISQIENDLKFIALLYTIYNMLTYKRKTINNQKKNSFKNKIGKIDPMATNVGQNLKTPAAMNVHEEALRQLDDLFL